MSTSQQYPMTTAPVQPPMQPSGFNNYHAYGGNNNSRKYPKKSFNNNQRKKVVVFLKTDVQKYVFIKPPKNAVKKVTVPYSYKKASFSAVQTHRKSKDFWSLGFARDCVIEDANNSTLSF